jgi:hypothetical protein
MRIRVPTLAVTAFFAASIASIANVAVATPIDNALAMKNVAPTTVETVRWGGGGWGGRGWGWGVGAGIVAGAIVGGALAAPYYGYGPYYAYPRAYYGPPGYYALGPYYAPRYYRY